MKKSTKISLISIIVGIFLVFVGIVVSVQEVRDGKWNEFYDEIDEYSNKKMFTSNEKNKITTDNFGKDIENLNINIVSNDIEFRKSDDDEVHVEYDKNSVYVSQVGNTLNISTKSDENNEKKSLKHINFGFVNVRSKSDILVYLPEDVKPNMDIITVSGDVEINNVSYDAINIESTSGDIEADYLDVLNDIDITTVSGDVELGLLKEYNITVDTVSGDCNVGNSDTGVASNINVSTVSGDIDIDY